MSTVDDEDHSDKIANGSLRMVKGYRYAGCRVLKDGRLRVDRSDGAGITLSISDWEKMVADFFTRYA